MCIILLVIATLDSWFCVGSVRLCPRFTHGSFLPVVVSGGLVCAHQRCSARCGFNANVSSIYLYLMFQ